MQISQQRSGCTGLNRLYLWAGYCAVRWATSTERAPNSNGMQPDQGNETISLVRDVLTGSSLYADNVTDRQHERPLEADLDAGGDSLRAGNVPPRYPPDVCKPLPTSRAGAGQLSRGLASAARDARGGAAARIVKGPGWQRLRGRQSEQGDCLGLPLARSRRPAPPGRRCTDAALRLVRAWTQRPTRWDRRQDRR
jgi:hypothetical protein